MFLLPLKEAINLVGFALENGVQGDIFVRNASSCSMGDLAQALKNIFHSNSEIKIIGMRHGEKMHETLVSKEELLRSKDLTPCVSIVLFNVQFEIKKNIINI